LERPRGLRAKLAPPDPSVPDTPWSGDLPPCSGPTRELWDQFERASPTAATLTPATEATRLAQIVESDLVDGIGRLAAGADALTQQAVRRVLFARLGWLEARLGAQPHLTDDGPTGVDRRLAGFLRLWGAGELPGLPPIDPALADYPLLEAYASRRAEEDYKL
ncbi:MAG: hypothetical protein LBG60_00770, partial [Bifidobacteriaceae bacterium]|nr:hypothetical protein [Bifidobacteriaceae bacterium]